MFLNMKTTVLIFLLLVLIGNPLKAECLTNEKIVEIINGSPYSPIEGISADISLEEAYCSQKKYVKILRFEYFNYSPITVQRGGDQTGGILLISTEIAIRFWVLR